MVGLQGGYNAADETLYTDNCLKHCLSCDFSCLCRNAFMALGLLLVDMGKIAAANQFLMPAGAICCMWPQMSWQHNVK